MIKYLVFIFWTVYAWPQEKIVLEAISETLWAKEASKKLTNIININPEIITGASIIATLASGKITTKDLKSIPLQKDMSLEPLLEYDMKDNTYNVDLTINWEF